MDACADGAINAVFWGIQGGKHRPESALHDHSGHFTTSIHAGVIGDQAHPFSTQQIKVPGGQNINAKHEWTTAGLRHRSRLLHRLTAGQKGGT
jgi:hypothetical protein